mgnify:CR=1 FL=1
MENRYEKYKDSGIAWIGNIPEHWEVKKLGHLYIPRNEKVSDKDYPALSVTMQGVLLQLENVAKTNDGDNRKLVKIGDFAINSRSDRRGSCGISKYDGSVSLINIVLTPINDMNPVYYEWLFHSSLFSDEYYRWGHGIVNDLWTTRWQEMKNIQIAAPPLHEQQLIATYLDQKCSEIDELITLQEEMITKLQSYKQSVITEAVTKGLDKNVPLKDSGIEWIGEIPEHWKITKIQYLAQLKSGYNLTTEEIKDSGLYPVYGGNGIRGYYDKYFLEGDYVLIGRQGALCGNINYSTGKSWATEHAVVCYPKTKYITKWFGELLRVMNLNQYSLAAAQPGLAVERIKLLPIPIIPLSEQQTIANYLDQKCSEIDELISIKQQKIEKLKDYKKSLIFECVTGKRKV